MNISTTRSISFQSANALQRLQAQSLSSAAAPSGTGAFDSAPAELPSDSVSLSSGALRELEGGNLARDTRVAQSVYRRHGAEEHSLSDRAEVESLITRSPQIDNVSGTHNDEIRCGGAALLNAMLLDGGYEANARAIRSLATPAPGEEGRLAPRAADGNPAFSMTDDQRRALDSMEHGHMTPNEAAQIQEMLFQMTDGISDGTTERDPANTGITNTGMRAMMSRLSAAGAFPNSSEVNLRMDQTGPDACHWTTTVTAGGTTTHADSWPGRGGEAEVFGGDRSELIYRDGAPADGFESDVTLTRGPLGSRRVSGRGTYENADGSTRIGAF